MNYTPVPTILPNSNWSEEGRTAQAKALRGFIVYQDTSALIHWLTSYSNAQRTDVRATYEKLFSRQVCTDLKTEFHTDFGSLVAGMFSKPMEYAVKYVEKSLGHELNTKNLIDILGPLTNEEILELQELFRIQYNVELKQKILTETSGGLRFLFELLLDGKRKSNTDVNSSMANQHAIQLIAILENSPATFDKLFLSLLTTESFPTLRMVFYNFQKINSDANLDKVIDAKFSGDLRIAVRGFVDLIRQLPFYYAQRLQKAFEGWSIDTKTLSIIVITRCEIDLGNIKEEYKYLTGHELHKDIKSHTNGEHRKCLLHIIGKK